MRFAWVNTGLLILLGAQLVSGCGGLISGSEERRWILWLHGVGAYAILVLLPWKGAIVVEAFRRRPGLTFQRAAFLLLLALLLGALATGFAWTFGGFYAISGYSLITIHIILAVALLPPLAWHVVARGFIFRAPDAIGRRMLLRLGAVSLAGLALWQIAGLSKSALRLAGAGRRFTGSYEVGSFTGVFPVVSWLFDYPAPVHAESWRLIVEGAVARPLALTAGRVEQLAGETTTALLDCTGGWYSTQVWRGVGVARLLEMAGPLPGARSVTFEAVSGYGRRFALEEARRFLLATHVNGQRLDHGHGFPLRLVAPDYRGFAWVKWVTRIRVNETSELLQPPVPLQ